MIFVGDLHGEWRNFAELVQSLQLVKKNFIQVGDWGLGFQEYEKDKMSMEHLNGWLQVLNNHLYIIRGNHDNPEFFVENSPVNGSHLHFLPDYSVREIEGKRILFVGGALSVDRAYRVAQGQGYWVGEGFQYDKERLKQLDLKGISIVVTHSAPTVAPPYEFNNIVEHHTQYEEGIKDELNLERAEIDKLMEYVVARSNPKYWIYGHYHMHEVKRRKKINFVALDTGQMLEIT